MVWRAVQRRDINFLCSADGWDETDFKSALGNFNHRGFLAVFDVQGACPHVNHSDEFPVLGSDLTHWLLPPFCISE